MITKVLLLLACLAASLPAPAAEVVDDSDRRVRLDAPADRIISLAPSLTELLFAIGAGDAVVAVVEYSNFPPEARQLPVVGRHDLLDMERIVSLRPDLVVVWKTGNPEQTVRRLEELGIAVYVAEPKNLASIAAHMEKLSLLAGTREAGLAAADRFRSRLSDLRARYHSSGPVDVFYQIWNEPLISVGGNELIHDIIELCGGRNVFADLPLSPRVSEEAVLAADPDVIIASGMSPERPPWLDDWKRWSQLRAVAGGHLYSIPPDYVQRHSPRALIGASQMCEHIDRVRAAAQ